MSDRQLLHWPAHAGRHLEVPHANLFENAQRSAVRSPDKPFLTFYDSPLSFREFHDDACKLAGFLAQRCGIGKGDRVMVFMQNCPQFAISYYGILRANAVVVPVNPMNLTQELAYYIDDADVTTVIVSQELFDRIAPLLHSDGGLQHVIVVTYSDYLREPTTLNVPETIAASYPFQDRAGVIAWREVLAESLQPGPLTTGADDLAVMPYTSGTTGRPKGCMQTHGAVMHSLVAGATWFGDGPDATVLAAAPWFHVTGMQFAMNIPLYAGNTVVVLPRWDRTAAAELIQRYRVSSWTTIPTMVVDLLSHPNLSHYDISSLKRLAGGGAAMPATVAQRLSDMGLPYIEGYGLSETMGPTHINPPQRPKQQCLGIPIFNTDSRVVDPRTMQELPVGEVGEVVIHSPQMLVGYWKNPNATEEVFAQIDGKRFLRTGDLGSMDEDGYFFLVDRLKRMINASGYKVWPAEVESSMYRNPTIQEACVIAARDSRRGETVKAVVVLKPEWRGITRADDIVEWCRQNMAAYKYPRIVELVDALPKSGSGKIMWRELQDRENEAAA